MHPLPTRRATSGSVEGHDVVTGARADVVVTDGFTGNVLLKGVEAALAAAPGPFPPTAVPRAAALLGVAGTVVVCHGAAGGDGSRLRHRAGGRARPGRRRLARWPSTSGPSRPPRTRPDRLAEVTG